MHYKFLCVPAFLSLAVSVSASSGSFEDQICPDGGGACYPRIFEPSDNWQIIRPDQEVPAGLHIRMDFQTGLREAKYLNDADDTQQESSVIAIDEESNAAVVAGPLGMAEDSEEGTEPGSDDSRNIWGDSTYNHKPNPYLSASEFSEFSENLEYVISSAEPSHESTLDSSSSLSSSKPQHDANDSSNNDFAKLISSFKIIEDFAHEIDFGVRLAEPNVLSALLYILASHKKPEVRSLSARTIGAALRNNAPALDLAAPAKTITNLLQSIVNEPDSEVRARTVFALGSAIQGRFGRQEFWTSHGGESLRQRFLDSDAGDDYMGRCAIFVEDSFVNEDMISDTVTKSNENGLQLEMGQWCSAFQDALSQERVSNSDARNKIFSALVAIKTRFPTYCPVQDSFRQWIARKVDERAQLKRLQKPGSAVVIHSAQSDDSSFASEVEFMDRLVETRHVLFGNPKASRKAFVDEF
ncbi:uncharacterized protein V1516DRAFT_546020 [Lipomyces oligophaga]|uniref:uncharacterized protein n=1 Tax=Lipomyces oligophaga TaxID=45792 RepID=UPI0034CE0539